MHETADRTRRWSQQMRAYLSAKRRGLSDRDAAIEATGHDGGATVSRFVRRMATNTAMQEALRQDATALEEATGVTLVDTIQHLEGMRAKAVEAKQMSAAFNYDKLIADMRGHIPKPAAPFGKGANGAAAEASVVMIDFSTLTPEALDKLAERVAHVRQR